MKALNPLCHLLNLVHVPAPSLAATLFVGSDVTETWAKLINVTQPFSLFRLLRPRRHEKAILFKMAGILRRGVFRLLQC